MPKIGLGLIIVAALFYILGVKFPGLAAKFGLA